MTELINLDINLQSGEEKVMPQGTFAVYNSPTEMYQGKDKKRAEDGIKVVTLAT